MGASIDATILGKFLKIMLTAVELIYTQCVFWREAKEFLIKEDYWADYCVLKNRLTFISKTFLFKPEVLHFSLKMQKLFWFKTVLNYYEWDRKR